MIVDVLVDGVKVNNEYTLLAGIRDGAAANIDINSYSRGGRSGVSLGLPFYRGYVIGMDWRVKGNTYAQLLQQRDRLARFFRVKPDKTIDQKRQLTFVMVDGSSRVVDVVFSPFQGSILPENTTSTIIQVSAMSEREFLVSSAEMSTVVNVLDSGGFAIPFDIPFSIANSPSTQPSVINNQGNAEYYPRIIAHGPLNQFTLQNLTTGKSFEYTGELLEGDELAIDLYERTAILNDNTNALADIAGDWFWLESGNNSLSLTTVSGNGYIEVFYRHAWRGL
jgi:hypothetical protein